MTGQGLEGRSDELIAQLEATFAEEIEERLQTMVAALLELERARTPRRRQTALQTLGRDAHNLKGGAQLVGRNEIATLAHALETHLAAGDLVGANPQPIFNVVDAIDRLRRPGSVSDEEIGRLVSELEEGIARQRTQHVATTPKASAPRAAAEPAAQAQSPKPRRVEPVAVGPGRAPERTSAPSRAPERSSAPVPTRATRRDSPRSADRSVPRTSAGQGPRPSTRDDVDTTLAGGQRVPVHEVATTPAGGQRAPAGEVATTLAPTQPTGSESARTASAQRMVRVSTERLDAVLARTADLIAARNTATRQWEAMRSAADEFRTWQAEWNRIKELAASVVGSTSATGRSSELQASLARAESQSARLFKSIRHSARDASLLHQRLGQLSEAFESDLLGLRMVPIGTLFRQFPRMVRDLAMSAGKTVEFEGLGWETPMDRDLIERLRDPVMHLLRNAVDHGIEGPEVRRARGKPEAGSIVLEASPRAGEVAIEVRDDGAGIDVERVARRATQSGIASEEMTQPLKLGLIFESGVSTADRVTDVSGRGIGLDVVRTQISALGGTVDVRSELGAGTRFVLRVPLTLLSTRVVIVLAGGRRYGLPISGVERVEAYGPERLTTLGDRLALTLPDGPVILAELAALLGLPEPSSPSGGTRTALVLATAAGRVALGVDRIESEQEVVLENLGSLLGTVPLYAGAALVDDGPIMLVLDPGALAERALSEGAPTRPRPGGAARDGAGRPEIRPVRVLVVDDSITTRTLERNILAAAGFDVLMAVDGLDGLRVIRQERPDIVIADVDMPKLDGLAMTARIKADDDTRAVPVILVTAAESPEQQERGFAAGADAYIPKSTFSQQRLLQSIRELVG